MAEFDVLVGINLLREGLDIPEVSLVAILDADKEGFLRSETSLVQTIGRAARHINGKGILYAARVTGSMQRAIDETARRRAMQEQFNQDNNITPMSILKSVTDIMVGARSERTKGRQYFDKVAEEGGDYSVLTPELVTKKIKQLEEQMYHHARDLEFEEAARIRDEIKRLRDHGLGLSGLKTG